MGFAFKFKKVWDLPLAENNIAESQFSLVSFFGVEATPADDLFWRLKRRRLTTLVWAETRAVDDLFF